MKTANEYEKAWYKEGKQAIVGIDEAGRGPIAGPLVVAAEAFPMTMTMMKFMISKKLSEKKRELRFRKIIKEAREYHILIVDTKTIDTENIYRATQNAMQKLCDEFQMIDGVLTDAMPLPFCKQDCISLVKGDQRVLVLRQRVFWQK